MSRLYPNLMVLDKGLNLQAPKILAPEGSVLDSLNYEQVDFQGQKRIDGYARYDGSRLPALDDFVLVAGATIGENDIAFNDDDIPYGVFVGNVDTVEAIAVFNENALPDGYEWGRDVVADEEVHYNYLLAFTQVLRDRVEFLPGAIAGLHWFRDRLYAVADIAILVVAGQLDVMSNDQIVDSDDPPNTYTVLDRVYYDGNTYVLVDTLDSVSSFTVVRTSEAAVVTSQIAGYKASIYESRNEQQVLEEDGPAGPYDFGWRFKHLGWAVPFKEGNSSFGSLTSLNQNRQGVGVEGPTSVAGDTGRPLVLTQKVAITNRPTQVNGWKTSSSPSVYSLEADALDDVDSVTIYADAYFSWDGTTGAVSAPGITGEGMIEYPATNTVVVDV